jgi:hypothetical protein
MKEVTKEIFYAAVMNVDAVISIEDHPVPYTAVYKFRHGSAIGQSVPSSDPVESAIGEGQKYFLFD